MGTPGEPAAANGGFELSTRGIVDLRSDTLALPTAAMREASASADVGDEVWGEDPSVPRLDDVDREDIDRAVDAFREITKPW